MRDRDAALAVPRPSHRAAVPASPSPHCAASIAPISAVVSSRAHYLPCAGATPEAVPVTDLYLRYRAGHKVVASTSHVNTHTCGCVPGLGLSAAGADAATCSPHRPRRRAMVLGPARAPRLLTKREAVRWRTGTPCSDFLWTARGERRVHHREKVGPQAAARSRAPVAPVCCVCARPCALFQRWHQFTLRVQCTRGPECAL